jgi:citrate synthase
LYPDTPELALARAFEHEAVQLTGLQGNLDLALGTLAHLLHLPAGAGLAVFAIGRTVGWIGQVIEQYAVDGVIRPRARYTGVMPKGATGAT